MVNICIIPAAGKGTRWAPVSQCIPKEMLPLVNRPVIEWVIKEVIDSGYQQIIVVINKHKQIIKNYLKNNNEINQKVKLCFVNQDEPLGLAHAIFVSKDFIKDEPFGMALPDLPTISHKSVMSQLTQSFQTLNGRSHIVSLSQFPANTSYLYTACLTKGRKGKLLRVAGFYTTSPAKKHNVLLRNKLHNRDGKLRLSGRYIFQPTILPLIETCLKKNSDSEVKEFHILKESLIVGQTVTGLVIQGRTYDTGTPIAYARAYAAFLRKRQAL